jgi:cell division protein FtsN
MKDYKPRTRQAKRKSGGSTLIGFFIVLAIGLIIAVAIAFYISKIPIPFVERGKTDKPSPAQADRDLAEKAKAPAGAAEKPRFDFYRILPGQEVPVSEKELKQQAAKPDAPTENYLIQAGAFQSPADADALKARLALLGLEASVEPAHLPDKGTLYRVRLGPYTQLDEINRVRQALSQNGVEASLVKVKN